MNVCIISPNYPPDSALDSVGDFTRFIALELARTGHSVCVVTSADYSGDGEMEGIRIIPYGRKWDLGEAARLPRLLKKRGVEGVH